jgi:GDPmannose 4,6-dehydratase
LHVKDLDAVVDWGAAEDYVRAMWLTLQQAGPDEYVISSGVGRTVREFAETAFAAVNLRASDSVMQPLAPSLSRGLPRIGNSSRIRHRCGWELEIAFEDLVRSMVRAQIGRLQGRGVN